MINLLLFLLGAALFFGIFLSPILSISAIRRTTRLRRDLDRLREQLRATGSPIAGSDQPPTEDAGGEEAAPTPSAAAARASADPASPPVLEDALMDLSSEDATEGPWNMPVPEVAVPAPPAPPGPKSKASGIEEAVTSRWMVWLGGVTIALGGIFLVKYSIDQNLLSPPVRIFFGCLLGFGLAVGGEWLRRQPLQRAIASVRPNQVPPALTAAGVAVAFGSVYAGYALYDLFSPLVAFGLLSVVAMGALGLSLLQGPFIAGLGILGAFGIPLLVTSTDPSAWGLFSFLLFIAASALAVVRYKNWWWLAWLSLAGSAQWEFIWLTSLWQAGDALPLAVHLIAMLVLYSGVRYETLAEQNHEL